MLKLMFRCGNVHGLFDISFSVFFFDVSFRCFFSMSFSINCKIGFTITCVEKPAKKLEQCRLLSSQHRIDLSQQHIWVLISGRIFLTSCRTDSKSKRKMGSGGWTAQRPAHNTLKSTCLADARRSIYDLSLTSLVAKARALDRTVPNVQLDHAQSPRSI